MFTLRNRTNSPLKVDLGPAFGVVRVPGAGTLDVDGDWSDVALNKSVKAWFDRRTIVLVDAPAPALEPAAPAAPEASAPKRKPGRQPKEA